MNERIKALAKKHNLVRWDPDSQSYELNGDIEELYWFAELMVKECAEHLNSLGDDYACIELLQHFGVEE